MQKLPTDRVMQIYIHRLRKYLGAYLLHFTTDLHAVVFSAGIGENSALVRERMLAGLEVSCDRES